jgi:hypothetical protein
VSTATPIASPFSSTRSKTPFPRSIKNPRSQLRQGPQSHDLCTRSQC